MIVCFSTKLQPLSRLTASSSETVPGHTVSMSSYAGTPFSLGKGEAAKKIVIAGLPNFLERFNGKDGEALFE